MIKASTFFSLFFFVTLLSCQSTKSTSSKSKAPEVTFHFQLIAPYCGGARPSEQMENERSKGSAWVNQFIYLSINESEPKKFQTDSLGNLKLPYQAGNYCFYLPYKMEQERIKEWKSAGWEFDSVCLEKKREECDFSKQLETATDTTYSFRVYGRCAYQGPIPCTTNPGMPPP